MIRDWLGSWIEGFTINMSFCSSVRVELWAILKGLELAYILGIRKLILKSDSMLVVNLITQESKKVDVNFADIQSKGFADKRVSS